MMSSLIEKYIDCCIINGSHYDISLACVELLKDCHKYIGDNVWEFKNNNNEWCVDDKCSNLKNDIKTTVCNAFIERSIFWENKSRQDSDINISIDDKFRSSRLLKISSKLKDDKYISTIIKESKQFFNLT